MTGQLDVPTTTGEGRLLVKELKRNFDRHDPVRFASSVAAVQSLPSVWDR